MLRMFLQQFAHHFKVKAWQSLKNPARIAVTPRAIGRNKGNQYESSCAEKTSKLTRF